MKDLRVALRTLLLSDGTISGLVGGTRIYPGTAPQGTTQPTIVLNLITEGSDYHLLGSSQLGTARMQVDCWAQSADQAVTLAGYVYDVLSGYSGVISTTSSPVETFDIQGIFHDQGRDDYDATAKLHTRRRDFIVWYRL